MAEECAFPNSAFQPGMTLRDWFAGQALGGILANSESCDATGMNDAGFRWLAANAYEIADAMLTARSTETGEDAG